MKLYVVTLPIVHEFVEVRDVAKKVDPHGVVTVAKQDGRSFEFQNKVGAEEVARVFEGIVDIIEYEVGNLYK